MDALFYSQIQFILKLGNGIKACLFDDESKCMIGSLIPLSLFNDHCYFHFDLLSNKNRSKVEGITCLVILRPDSLKILLEELVYPYFDNYIVLFTSQVDPLVLELLANADINSVISEVHEINVDLFKQSPNLYITKSVKYKRNLEGLCSALYSLEVNPEILIFNGTDENINEEKTISFLAKDIKNKCSQFNFTKKGTLVLLKRNFDLITPLVQDWYYHSMINDHLELRDGIVKIKDKTYQLTDSFSISNFFNEIATVGEEIRNLAKEVEKSKAGMSNFEDIQEILNSKSVAEMHLSIYNSIASETDNLVLLSELQSKILKSSDFKISSVFNQLQPETTEKYNEEITCSEYYDTENKKTSKLNSLEMKFFNLLLIYFLKNIKDWPEHSKLFPRYRSLLLRFYESYKPQSYCYKYEFDSNLDPKLGYIPPIRKIIKHICLNKIKENAFVTVKSKEDQTQKSDYTVSPIILYVDGGITLREYREALLTAKRYDVEIILISTEILNTKSFLNDIL